MLACAISCSNRPRRAKRQAADVMNRLFPDEETAA